VPPPRQKTAASPVMIVLDHGEEDTEQLADAQACLPPPPAEGPCAFDGCGKSSQYRCRECGDAFYCSRAHQKADWARDGGRGGHFKKCKPRAWLPPLPVPPQPPQQQQPWLTGVGTGDGDGDSKMPPPPLQGGEDQGAPLWSGSGGGEGNSAKRAKVGDSGTEEYLNLDLGHSADSGNPQAMWSGTAHAPGSSNGSGGGGAEYYSSSYWKEGGSGRAGSGGATTEPVCGTMASASASVGALIGPISPMGGAGFEDPGLPPAIHPAGFGLEDGGMGMAAGPVPALVPQPLSLPLHQQEPQPPAEEAVVQLMEMGFEEADVRSALVVNSNDVQRALDYLLGGGGPPPGFDSDHMATAMLLTSMSQGGLPTPTAEDWARGADLAQQRPDP
jgi:hypothetical protein